MSVAENRFTSRRSGLEHAGGAARPSGSCRLSLTLRLALREMRGGLRGFGIFLACIALGTAAIAGVNSVSRSITEAIASEGRVILGGDIRVEINNRTAGPDERADLQALGDVAKVTALRSMVRLPDGSDQALVEVKAVDRLYPLYGALRTNPGGDFDTLYAPRDGIYGIAVAPILLDRLQIGLGERLRLGRAEVEVRAAIEREPDAISEGFGFAPRLLTSQAALEASGLVTTGSLVEHVYKLRLDDETIGSGRLGAIAETLRTTHAEDGWAVRTRDNAAPALTANITRFSQFLTLVGLTALIVGGVGVANAVRAHIDGKRGVIATLKCLGASGGLVFAIYLVQITVLALLGIAAGLLVGAAIPFVAIGLLGDLLPVSARAALHPPALALAALFGVITALAFAVLPLGRARDVPATALFREQGFDTGGWPRPLYLGLAALLVASLAGLAVLTAFDRYVAGIFLLSTAFAFVVLRVVSVLIKWLARRSPAMRSPALRLAVGNIHRPGALTSSVVLSLGLGLALLVTLALIDGNLRREIAGNLTERAPNFFFVDIQPGERDAFVSLVEDLAPDGAVDTVPMLRGRIVSLNGTDVADLDVPPEARWVLRGDRGITYAPSVPDDARLTAGRWWADDHDGAPLVSFSAEEGRELGLELGDTVTVSVLGRAITATIANFREVEWESLSINFVMVFSPNTFAGAPHAWLATLTDPSADMAMEGEIVRAVTNAFPTITTVRVKDALEIVNTLVGQLATAIRAAAAVALIASVLVLAGALAAGNRARIHDAVVLKTLGATRGTLIRAFTYEYLILGLATATFALFAGGVAAWYVVAQIMMLPSVFLPSVAASVALIALLVTVGIGLVGTWRILGMKAAPVLRSL